MDISFRFLENFALKLHCFNARSMDVFISKLRKKLQRDTTVQIVNVRGYGYKLICD